MIIRRSLLLLFLALNYKVDILFFKVRHLIFYNFKILIRSVKKFVKIKKKNQKKIK